MFITSIVYLTHSNTQTRACICVCVQNVPRYFCIPNPQVFLSSWFPSNPIFLFLSRFLSSNSSCISVFPTTLDILCRTSSLLFHTEEWYFSIIKFRYFVVNFRLQFSLAPGISRTLLSLLGISAVRMQVFIPFFLMYIHFEKLKAKVHSC